MDEKNGPKEYCSFTVQDSHPFSNGSIWPSSSSVTPVQRGLLGEKLSLSLRIIQSKTFILNCFHPPIPPAPFLLPFYAFSVDYVWRKQIYLIISGSKQSLEWMCPQNIMSSGAKFSDISRRASLGSWCCRLWCPKGVPEES